MYLNNITFNQQFQNQRISKIRRPLRTARRHSSSSRALTPKVVVFIASAHAVKLQSCNSQMIIIEAEDNDDDCNIWRINTKIVCDMSNFYSIRSCSPYNLVIICQPSHIFFVCVCVSGNLVGYDS